MNREQMVVAANEIRYLLVLFEQQKVEPSPEPFLKRVLREREAWLRSEVAVLTPTIRIFSEADLGKAVKEKLAGIEAEARMLTKAAAIDYLRSINCLNHEPLRRIEQEWLDSVFIHERMSKAWVLCAAGLATSEQQGIHIRNHVRGPCACPDSVAAAKLQARQTAKTWTTAEDFLEDIAQSENKED